MTRHDRPHSQTFLLRIWVEDNNGHPVCRLSLRDADATPRLFKTPIGFYEHIHALLAAALETSGQEADPDPEEPS